MLVLSGDHLFVEIMATAIKRTAPEVENLSTWETSDNDDTLMIPPKIDENFATSIKLKTISAISTNEEPPIDHNAVVDAVNAHLIDDNVKPDDLFNAKVPNQTFFDLIAYVLHTIYSEMPLVSGDQQLISFALKLLSIYTNHSIAQLKKFTSYLNGSSGHEVTVMIKKPKLSLKSTNSKTTPTAMLLTGEDGEDANQNMIKYIKMYVDSFGNLHNTLCSKISIMCPENVKIINKRVRSCKFTKDETLTGVQLTLSKRLLLFTSMESFKTNEIFNITSTYKSILINAALEQLECKNLNISELVKMCTYRKLVALRPFDRFVTSYNVKPTADDTRYAIMIDSFVLSPEIISNYGSHNYIKLYPIILKSNGINLIDFCLLNDDDNDEDS